MIKFITSERIKKLREQLINTKPEICSERASIVTEAYKIFSSYDISILRAKTLEKILKEMTVYILPEEIIVGNHSRRLRAAPVFPEFDVKFIEEEINDFGNRSGDPFILSEEDKRKLLEIVPFWKQFGTIKKQNLFMLPEENKFAGQGYVNVIDNEWNLENSDGHLAVDYQKLINKGLRYIISD
jgi:pyruvate-formate lyase